MSSQVSVCGCCEGRTSETPAKIDNRPGLSAIAYRVGTHSQFKKSMISALSEPKRSALQKLTARSDDDFSIALLDAAATMGDVLTFYQERLANEAYLRTATERRSLLELARLIGYKLRPGVAASTFLAFTLEDAAGAPSSTILDVGVKVQSIPGPGEKAQTFESMEKIEARVEWNAIKAQTRVSQQIQSGRTELHLKGVDTQLQRGDAILILANEREDNPDSENWEFRLLQKVAPHVDARNPEKSYTQVKWDDGLTKFITPLEKDAVKVFALRQRASLFGHNAPDPRLLSKRGTNLGKLIENGAWKNYKIIGNKIDLDTAYPKIVAGSWIVLVHYPRLLMYSPPPLRPPQAYEISRIIEGFEAFSFPDGGTLEIAPVNLLDSAVMSYLGSAAGQSPPYLEPDIRLYKAKHVDYPSRSDFALSGRVTRIHPDSEKDLQIFELRETVVFAQSEELELSDVPDTSVVTGASVRLAEKQGALTKDQWVVVTSKDGATGSPISEIVQVASVESDGFELTFTPALSGSYDRESFAINANVAHATHGETTQEVLGGGDATQPYQQFKLRQFPLTYVQSSTPSGAESTLELRVNDLLWKEVPTLSGHRPEEHVFVAVIDDERKTTIEFGDGVMGGRLPTGQDNVRAKYRKGIGLQGMVKAGQLSVLLTRPLGVKDVTNPKDATGAADPESLSEARKSAPLTVLTLDRAVSLDDYEDFARAFGGIAKAQATMIWDGLTRRVFITVAGQNGEEVLPTGPTYQYLQAALGKAGDPYVNFQVKSYQSISFRLAGSLKVDPAFVPDHVLAEVKEALETNFSFEAREFGQPVMLSEVYSVIQAVQGVVAVDIDKFHISGQPEMREARLLAKLPVRTSTGDIAAAELLTLDKSSLDELVYSL